MVSLDISELMTDFPEYRVALVVATGLKIQAPSPPSLEAAVASAEAKVRDAIGETPLAEIDALIAWRSAYKAFGVKKTSYRSSVERLLKSIQQGRGLPRINSLVDAYNAVSALHHMPVGADDLAKVSGPLAFRIARDDDTFIALGDSDNKQDPPKAGEVVYADGQKLLCRRWNWYQDARSAVSGGTANAALTVQSLGTGALVETVTEDLCAWLTDHCGATTAYAVADADSPSVSLGGD